MTKTSNGHKSVNVRENVKPNLTDNLSYYKSNNVALTRARDKESYTPGISSKTWIYDQERIVPGLNRLGTRVIRYNDTPFIYRPAGMNGENNTRQRGEPLLKTPMRVMYPQNTTFI